MTDPSLSSFDDIRSAVETALAADYPTKDDGDGDTDYPSRVYACDIGDDWVVYRDPAAKSKGYLKRDYSLDGDKAVLGTKPTPVARVTTYQPVNGGPSKYTEPPPTDLKSAGEKTRQVFAANRAANKQAKQSKK